MVSVPRYARPLVMIVTAAASLIPTFAASTDAEGVVVNLYDAGTARLALRDLAAQNFDHRAFFRLEQGHFHI